MATIYSYTFDINKGNVETPLMEQYDNCVESQDKSYWHQLGSIFAIYAETIGKVVYRRRTMGAFTLDSFKLMSREDIQYRVESQDTIFDYEMKRLKKEYNEKLKDVENKKKMLLREINLLVQK